MVGVTGQDTFRPVQLFDQHRPRQQVRPGHRPQRDHKRGLGAKILVKAVGAADQERDIANSGVLPLAELCGEDFAVEGFATLIKGDDRCIRRNCGTQQRRLAPLAARRIRPPSFLYLANFYGPAQTLPVAVDERLLWTFPGASNRGDDNAHRSPGARPVSPPNR